MPKINLAQALTKSVEMGDEGGGGKCVPNTDPLVYVFVTYSLNVRSSSLSDVERFHLKLALFIKLELFNF